MPKLARECFTRHGPTMDSPDTPSQEKVFYTREGRNLCGPSNDLASTRGLLPARSLAGAIALVQRGLCPFETKAAQAKSAGAVGIVYSDNRPGEANGIPTKLPLPGGMIANLDGDQLRAYLAAHGGRTTVRIGHDPLELETGRSGVITSFSSRGPTAFGHDLKPDLSAPGGQILSSTRANRASRSSTARRWRPLMSRARRHCCWSCTRAGRRRR